MSTRYVLVPLAGPDFYDEELGIRSLRLVDGVPLVVRALETRPWSSKKTDKIIFILRPIPQIDIFLRFVRDQFPRSEVVMLPSPPEGALLTALSAIACIKDFSAPVIVDLAEVMFEGIDRDPLKIFRDDSQVAGVVPYFRLSHPGAGDLQVENGAVTFASDREAISSFASVGTYFFRNAKCFLKAATMSAIRTADSAKPFSLCPSFNGLMSDRVRVAGVEVFGVRAIGKDQLRYQPAPPQKVAASGQHLPTGQLVSLRATG